MQTAKSQKQAVGMKADDSSRVRVMQAVHSAFDSRLNTELSRYKS
jgi:hypothetical protein